MEITTIMLIAALVITIACFTVLIIMGIMNLKSKKCGTTVERYSSYRPHVILYRECDYIREVERLYASDGKHYNIKDMTVSSTTLEGVVAPSPDATDGIMLTDLKSPPWCTIFLYIN